jgi:hypothetical protein
MLDVDGVVGLGFDPTNLFGDVVDPAILCGFVADLVDYDAFV